MKNQTLLMIYTYSEKEHILKIKEDIAQVNEYFQIKDISTVYKNLQKESDTATDEQIFCTLSYTDEKIDTVISTVKQLRIKGIPLRIGIFGSNLFWHPENVIPLPEIVFNDVCLHCAAEVGPELIHPITKKNFKEMDLSQMGIKFEFLHQGKIYIEHLRDKDFN